MKREYYYAVCVESKEGQSVRWKENENSLFTPHQGNKHDGSLDFMPCHHHVQWGQRRAIICTWTWHVLRGLHFKQIDHIAILHSQRYIYWHLSQESQSSSAADTGLYTHVPDMRLGVFSLGPELGKVLG